MASTDIKLFNRSKRTFSGHHFDAVDADGNPLAFTFKPDTTASFHPEDAKKLRRLYPKEIVGVDDITREFDTPATVASPDSVPLAQVQAMITKAVTEAIEAERARPDADEDAKIDAGFKDADLGENDDEDKQEGTQKLPPFIANKFKK